MAHDIDLELLQRVRRRPRHLATLQVVLAVVTVAPDPFLILVELVDAVEVRAGAGKGAEVTLGPDVAAGQRVQVVVPRGVWQGCLLAGGGGFALMGTTVAPGFERADYEGADRDSLIAAHPEVRGLIERLT